MKRIVTQTGERRAFVDRVRGAEDAERDREEAAREGFATRRDYEPGGRYHERRGGREEEERGRPRRRHFFRGVEIAAGEVPGLVVRPPSAPKGEYATLRALGESLQDELAPAVERGAAGIVRAAATAMVSTLIERTPVNTGRAVSNWLVTHDAPSSAVLPAAVPGHDGDTAEENREYALEGALEVIADYDGVENTSIHVTNNLRYIGYLNDGSPHTRALGFVEEALDAAARAAAETKMLED